MSDPYDDARWDWEHQHYVYCRGPDCETYFDPDEWSAEHEDHEPENVLGLGPGPSHGDRLAQHLC